MPITKEAADKASTDIQTDTWTAFIFIFPCIQMSAQH
jgi:hypothetical protein